MAALISSSTAKKMNATLAQLNAQRYGSTTTNKTLPKTTTTTQTTPAAQPATKPATTTTSTKTTNPNTGYGYAGVFNNPFFSLAGQAERITNVGRVLKTSLLGGDKIVVGYGATSTSGKILQAAAEHPFIVAGAAAATITAAGAAITTLGAKFGAAGATTAASAASTITPTAAASASGLTGYTAAALAGAGGGLLASSLFGGKQTSTQEPQQTTTQQQEQTPTQNPVSIQEQTTNTTNTQTDNSYRAIINSPYGRMAGGQEFIPTATQEATQTPYASQGQWAAPEQTTSNQSTNWATLITLLAGGFIIAKIMGE